MADQPAIEEILTEPLKSGGKLAARFRRVNTLLFAAASLIIMAVIAFLFNDVIVQTSSEYAGHYALSTAEALSAHINRELGLVSLMARSEAVIEWMADEDDLDKKDQAFAEMKSILADLYGFNMYIGLVSSLNQYRVEGDFAATDIRPVEYLDSSNLVDEWFFDCVKSDKDYMLNVGMDYTLQRKRVWINYKIVRDSNTLGVICTGLEFSHLVGELFSNYDYTTMRGLIVDDRGNILMDSAMMGDMTFLHSDYNARIEDEFTNPQILTAFRAHLNASGNYHEATGEPEVVMLSSGSYRHMTISPIGATNWAVVILSGGATLFEMSQFLPILITVLVLMIVVAFTSSAVNYRLIFLPMKKLGRSLELLRENLEGRVYGIERDDELGELSKMIQDLFTKANIDGLTGIYNRRFMENNLDHIMGMLSRTNGLLSVLMLDIDHFKKFNDAFGHDQGDVCLRAVASSLSIAVERSSDFTARYGGEEFIAILPNTDEDGAHVVAEKLLENVRALNIEHPGNSAAPVVTVSIGVTTGKVNYGNRWEAFVKRADEALYVSKQNGRNQYTFIAMQEI